MPESLSYSREMKVAGGVNDTNKLFLYDLEN